MTIEVTDTTSIGTYNYFLRVYGFKIEGVALTVSNFVNVPIVIAITGPNLADVLTSFRDVLEKSFNAYSLVQYNISVQLPQIATEFGSGSYSDFSIVISGTSPNQSGFVTEITNGFLFIGPLSQEPTE